MTMVSMRKKDKELGGSKKTLYKEIRSIGNSQYTTVVESPHLKGEKKALVCKICGGWVCQRKLWVTIPKKRKSKPMRMKKSGDLPWLFFSSEGKKPGYDEPAGREGVPGREP